MRKGQRQAEPGVASPSSGFPGAGPADSYSPKRGTNMAECGPVRAKLGWGPGSQVGHPRPTREEGLHRATEPHLLPDGQLQALCPDARPQALEVLTKVLLISGRVGHEVLTSTQEQHGLLPHAEDEALLPGPEGEGSHHHYPAQTPGPHLPVGLAVRLGRWDLRRARTPPTLAHSRTLQLHPRSNETRAVHAERVVTVDPQPLPCRHSKPRQGLRQDRGVTKSWHFKSRCLVWVLGTPLISYAIYPLWASVFSVKWE